MSITRSCCFDRGSHCGILAGAKHCSGCKFFKTDADFKADWDRSQRILEAKGLESYQTTDKIITVRRRKI